MSVPHCTYGKRRALDAESLGRVVEERALDVPVERLRLAREVRDENVRPPVAVEVADRDAHPGAGIFWSRLPAPVSTVTSSNVPSPLLR